MKDSFEKKYPNVADMKDSFEEKYPNIANWVADGSIEIGYESATKSFIRAYDEGGMIFSGKQSYKNLDEALDALEEGIAEWFDENG